MALLSSCQRIHPTCPGVCSMGLPTPRHRPRHCRRPLPRDGTVCIGMPTVIAFGTSSLSGEIPQQSRHVNVLRTCHAVTLATSTMTCQMGGDNIYTTVLLQVGHNRIEATFSLSSSSLRQCTVTHEWFYSRMRFSVHDDLVVLCGTALWLSGDVRE